MTSSPVFITVSKSLNRKSEKGTKDKKGAEGIEASVDRTPNGNSK